MSELLESVRILKVDIRENGKTKFVLDLCIVFHTLTAPCSTSVDPAMSLVLFSDKCPSQNKHLWWHEHEIIKEADDQSQSRRASVARVCTLSPRTR